MLRSHTCGQLREEDVGKPVKLCGWVNARRDHGDLIFIDLRDRYGTTQVVFNPQKDRELHTKAHDLKSEYVVQVHLYGTLRRFSDQETPGIWSGKLPTNATIRDLMNAIGTSDKEVSAAAINGKTYPFDTVIPPGAKIILVTPIGAG